MDLHSSAVRRRPVEVRIGCSGWQYKHWRSDFYPAELPAARWFAHYALHFDAPPRQTIEFREPSWYDDRVFALLERHRVALCLHDMEGSASGRRLVGPFVYVRFHFGDRRYGGAYDEERLDEWGRWLADRVDEGREVFGYFNNDVAGHAPRDAVRLRNRVKRRLAA